MLGKCPMHGKTMHSHAGQSTGGRTTFKHSLRCAACATVKPLSIDSTPCASNSSIWAFDKVAGSDTIVPMPNANTISNNFEIMMMRNAKRYSSRSKDEVL
jgi:hypothetical protein